LVLFGVVVGGAVWGGGGWGGYRRGVVEPLVSLIPR